MIPKIDKLIKKTLLDELGWKDPKSCKLMVVCGSNASGKSMIRRCLSMACKEKGIEAIPISMEFRTRSGDIARSFVFNDESDHATGITTAQTIITGMSTSRGRDSKHLLMWDEPEIGMSEELQHASVDHIVSEFGNWPKHLEGAVFFTHSRIFADRLVKELGATFVYLGGEYQTVDEWLARDVRGNVRPLEELCVESQEKWRRILQMLK